MLIFDKIQRNMSKKCKKCKGELPENAVYCPWCGAKLTVDRSEVKVPAPRKLPSGTWFAQMTVRGERVSVSAASESEYYVKARAIKAGLVEAAKAPERKTVQRCMDDYIESRKAALSPNTIRGYKAIAGSRWRSVAQLQLDRVTNWQKVVNDEAKLCSPKTLKNAWLFLSAALSASGIHTSVALPTVPAADTPWLTAEQIKVFLDAAKGKPCELAALLALHSLRRGEIYGLVWDDIQGGTIHVHRALAQSPDGGTVLKPTPKNQSSERYVTIVIPRLLELCTGSGDNAVVTTHIGTATKGINDVCRSAGLPLVGLHGLRRSFASLCHRLGVPELETMRQGGWSDYATVHKFYIKLDSVEAKTETQKLSDFFANC